MTTDAFLTILRGRGFAFSATDDGQSLKYQAPPGLATPEVIQAIRDRKTEILNHLSWGDDPDRPAKAGGIGQAAGTSGQQPDGNWWDDPERVSYIFGLFGDVFGEGIDDVFGEGQTPNSSRLANGTSHAGTATSDPDPMPRLDVCPTPRLGQRVTISRDIQWLDGVSRAGTTGWIVDSPEHIACPHRRELARDGIRRQKRDLEDDPDCDRRCLIWLDGEVRWVPAGDVGPSCDPSPSNHIPSRQ